MAVVGVTQIGTLKRLPLNTDYTDQVRIIVDLWRRCPRGTPLYLDGTGVGRGVTDMFGPKGVYGAQWCSRPWCVISTAGDEQRLDRETRTAFVPKNISIPLLQAAVFEHRLKIAGEIVEAEAFLQELREFQVDWTPAGRMTWNARSSSHDDMISAAAIAHWALSEGYGRQGAWHEPSPELAALALGRWEEAPRHTPMAIGVDPGKINDHTVVCVARSVRIDLPEFIADREGVHSMDGVPEDRHFEPVAQPESTVDGSHYVGSEGWFRDQDEQQKRAVAGAPGTGPLALTPTVRPVRRRRDEPQPGCAEWFELEREKARFAGRLNGRDATAAEAAEHENNLKTIREKHAV